MGGAANQLHDLPPLGAIVRRARLAEGLTLAQLGTRIGYSAATISRLERGKQKLRDVVVLRTLADALGIPLTELGLSDSPDQTRSQPGRAVATPRRLPLDYGGHGRPPLTGAPPRPRYGLLPLTLSA